MPARLGHVLYWIGFTVAVLTIFLVSTLLLAGRGEQPVVTFTGFGIAIVAYALGWALRYVLAGTAKSRQEAKPFVSGANVASDLVPELSEMARRARADGFETLAYLLDMARVEAELEGKQRKKRKSGGV